MIFLIQLKVQDNGASLSGDCTFFKSGKAFELPQVKRLNSREKQTDYVS